MYHLPPPEWPSPPKFVTGPCPALEGGPNDQRDHCRGIKFLVSPHFTLVYSTHTHSHTLKNHTYTHSHTAYSHAYVHTHKARHINTYVPLTCLHRDPAPSPRSSQWLPGPNPPPPTSRLLAVMLGTFTWLAAGSASLVSARFRLVVAMTSLNLRMGRQQDCLQSSLVT